MCRVQNGRVNLLFKKFEAAKTPRSLLFLFVVVYVASYMTRINYGASSFAGYVYINYWGDEPKSKIEVFEGDKKLKVQRILQDDPLQTNSSAVVRVHNARGRKITISKNTAQHMFRVKPDSTNTTIRIRTIDPFGRTFEDSLVRPHPFPPQMQAAKQRKRK